MRRSLAILAALALLAAIPATVSAGKATKETDHFVGISCDGITSTSGQGILHMGVSISDTFGPDAWIEMWHTTMSGPPDVQRDPDVAVTASYVGGVFNASIPLQGATGSGIVQATLTPVGETFPIDDSFRFGNVWERFTGIVQPLAADGTAVIDGKTFDLIDCFAEDTHVTTFRTNPNSFVERFTTADTRCDIENADGTTGGVFIDANFDDVFVDAFLTDGPGSPLGAAGSVLTSAGTGSGTLDYYDLETFEPLPGSASIEISLSDGGMYAYVLSDGSGKQMNRGRLIDVEGTLTFEGMPAFDLGNCVAFAGERKEIFHNPKGPKPTGKAPANDLVAGALALKVGGKTSQATRGAALLEEAPYSCMVFEDPFTGDVDVVPVEHTVWFKVAGTGGTVTVDTAGSDFDVVAAAYVRDGSGALVEVACVDDVPLDPFGRTLQAAVTFPTTAGTTYYVQIGGFPGFQSYGNLRVAVR